MNGTISMLAHGTCSRWFVRWSERMDSNIERFYSGVQGDACRSCVSDIPRIDRTSFAPKVEQPEVCDIIWKSGKIGKCTFAESCFDAVLLLACWAGNVPVMSYLLTSYKQYFSIDTLIDTLSGYNFKFTLYGCNGIARFTQLKCDNVCLLHAAAEGLRVDFPKLLL